MDILNDLCGLGLSFTLDGFRTTYIALSIFAWVLALLFAPRYLSKEKNKKRFYIFSIVTLLATLGVFASADLFTLFLFFEIMSLASYVWVVQDEKEKALKAGKTYMAVAIIGGLVLLMGILLLYTNIGTLQISELKEAASAGGVYGRKRLYGAAFCLFFGFAAKAGAFPIHIWLPKAHPVAPAPASALLSGVLTKAGVFGIMLVSFNIYEGDGLWGSFVMGIGLITMVIGALLAIFSIDIKRTLACSSVSQIGFIVTGIAAAVLLGEEGELAKYATFLHMINHTLVKLSVFLVAGIVYENTHSLDLNKIRGFGRKKPTLLITFMPAGLSLAGMPGFIGYLSKSGIHEALISTTVALSPVLVKCIEVIFLFSGGCTLCYMTKLFMCLFAEKNADKNLQREYENTKDYAGVIQKACIIIPACLVLATGVSLAVKQTYGLYEFNVLKGSLISILTGVLLYLVMVRLLLMDKKYLDMWPKWLDMEEYFYKPVLCTILPAVIGFPMRILDVVVDKTVFFLRKTVYKDAPISEPRIEGNFFTHLFGHALDSLKSLVKGEELTCDYEHKLSLKYIEQKENLEVAKRSLSFGLILACAGMFAMLIFILYLVLVK